MRPVHTPNAAGITDYSQDQPNEEDAESVLIRFFAAAFEVVPGFVEV